MKILMVLTSHDQLGDTGKKTGFWLEEFASPYYVFNDAGADVVLASPKGGQAPVDPESDKPTAQTEATDRYSKDAEAQHALANTKKLTDVREADFDAVFYPGGHGPLWDLAEDKDSIALLEAFHEARKPMALVCHGPGALRRVRAQDGSLAILGRSVTGFSNSEEAAVQLDKVVPFSIEDEFSRLGAIYEHGPDWGSHVVIDGRLITGQNPGSSQATAQALLKILNRPS